MIAQQAGALLWLRAMLWWRRISQQRQWGRLAISLLGIGMGAVLSVATALLLVRFGEQLRRRPDLLAEQGGSLAVFATWLASALFARLWFAFVPRGQTAFLDPRRFLALAVPARLVSALNFGAQLIDPAWLFFWPILVGIAFAAGPLPGMPGAAALLCAEALSVWAVAGVLHLAAAIGGAVESRVMLRRAFSVVLALLAAAGLQLAARPDRHGIPSAFAAEHWTLIAFTPPGWAAEMVRELAGGRPRRAVAPALLLLLLGAICAVLAHRLSLREARRPVESGSAPARRRSARGWRLPLLPESVSAVLEKEARTVLRIGWLQIVLVPIGFLLLRLVFLDPRGVSWVEKRPLLFAAVYAHLGVLELATNQFGRDLDAARGWFLWPVRARVLLAAKNLVAYALSLCIFAGLVLVARATGPVSVSEIGIGFCAHLATFPLLALVGNLASVLWPVPVRGMRLRRVRGAGPVGSRLAALALLGAAAWAPWAVSRLTGLPLAVAYLGEALAMAIAYGGVLAASAHLLETRREPLLAALATDE
ncbi:MAG: hypothetical protein ACJ79H_09320 [Myxococcales bacterium]